MRVVNLMVFTMLLTLANFASADTLTPPSANGGARDDYGSSTSLFNIASNFYKQVTGRLNGEDRKLHIQTVTYAAGYLDNGDVAEWSNPDSGSAGRVKVALTLPVQGGYCRLLYTEVEKDTNIKEYQEYACKTIDSQFWTFYTR